MQRFKTPLFIFMLAFMLQACGTFNLGKTNDISQDLAIADESIASAALAVTSMMADGLIEADTAKQVVRVINQADQIMNAAWLAYGEGNLATAADKSRLVNNLIRQARSQLTQETEP